MTHAGLGGAPRWPFEARVFASDSIFGWSFGRDAALHGETVAVGAPGAGPGNPPDNRGAAYVFVLDGTEWAEQAKLEAFDGEENDRFGAGVGVSGDRVVVGAWADDVGAEGDQGSGYVFQRVAGRWQFEQQLLASDGDELDDLGFSADIDGDTIVLGARSEEGAIRQAIEGCLGSGAAYVFELRAESWVETAKLFDPEGLCGDQFGHAVTVEDDTILVGAQNANIGPDPGRGAAYVYRRAGGTWVLEQKLLASDGTDPDEFGWSVTLDRDTALVGAQQKAIDGNVREGAAYVFKRRGSTWTEVQRLTASDGVEDLSFGRSVAVRGGVALIGAERDIEIQNKQGVVYEFREVNGVWQEVGWFEAPMGNGLDSFGRAIDLDDERALISNPGNIVVNPQGGTAWIFGRPGLFADGFEAGDTAAWDGTAEQ